MALEFLLSLVHRLLGLDPLVMIGILLVVTFIAFRVVAFFLRALLTGVAFGVFPVVANLLGIGVPLTLNTILWSMILGIALYFAYVTVSTGNRLINFVLSPFRGSFQTRTQRVVVKKVVRVEKEKEKGSS